MTGIGTVRRLTACAVGAAVGSLLILGLAAPAYAAAQPVVSFHGPAGGSTLTSPSVAITGSASFTPDPAYGGGITDIQVAVSFGGRTVASCDPCGSAGNTSFGFTPSFGANGPYSVAATVSANETLLATGLNPQSRAGSASTSFRLAVPPAAPRSVSTKVNGDGSVTVSWARNSEADLSGYQVQRKEPAGAWTVVAPNLPASTTTFTDSGTTHGGDFSYLVSAFRPGADGTLNTALVASAGLVGASVPVPPPPTTIPVVGQPIPFDTTTTTPPASTPAASGSNTPDLSAFLAQAVKPAATAGGKVQTSPSAPLVVPGLAGPPDTYDPNLPFAAGSSRQAAGGPRVALPGQPASSTQQRSILFSVAGGLFLCVAGFGLRSLNRRGGPPALESLGPPGAAGGAGGAAAGVSGAGGISDAGRVSGIGKIVPASVAAKAAARARARSAVSGGGPESPAAAWTGNPPPPAAAAATATTPARAANRRANPASAANPSPPPPAATPRAATPTPSPAVLAPQDPVAAAAPVAADLSEPAVALPASAVAPPEAAGPPEPPDPQRPRRPSWPASADRRPSVEEAVDYFRLLKAPGPLPDEEPAKVEVTAPAG